MVVHPPSLKQAHHVWNGTERRGTERNGEERRGEERRGEEREERWLFKSVALTNPSSHVALPFCKIQRPCIDRWSPKGNMAQGRMRSPSSVRADAHGGPEVEHPHHNKKDLTAEGAKGLTLLLGARTLLGTSASLLVTSALLVVTRSY